MLWWLRGVVDWLCRQGTLALELCFLFDGDGAFICLMALVSTMEVTEWNFFPSTPLLSLAFLVAVFVMMSVFAARPIFVMISLVPALVVPGISWLLFGDTVDCFLLLRLICVPWLQM